MRIFLVGFMGSGKTYWGRQLAEQLQIPFYDLDEVIVASEEKSIADIFSESGEESFRVKERDMLETLIGQNKSMVLSTGGGTPCFFNNIDTMKKYGVTVWLNTPVETILGRLLKEKAQRPLIRDIADQNLQIYIIRKLNERRMYYEQADVKIDNDSSITLNEFIQTILHA